MKAKFIEFALRAMSYLPFRMQRYLGSSLGRRLYRKKGRNYQVTRTNIQACFPHYSAEEQDLLIRNSLKATATVVTETPAIWFRGESWRQRLVVATENRELFDKAVASERGVLLIIPHFGNWELAGFWAARFQSTTAMYRTPRIKELDSLIRKIRDDGGRNTTVPATSRGVMAVVKALQEGGMTIILPDQQPDPRGGIFSPIFGQSALTMTLINRLILKTNPIVLVAYARRVEEGHILGFFEPEVEIYSEDQQTSVDAMNRSIEKLVDMAPEQYQWEYKRFRAQPEGQASFYK